MDLNQPRKGRKPLAGPKASVQPPRPPTKRRALEEPRVTPPATPASKSLSSTGTQEELTRVAGPPGAGGSQEPLCLADTTPEPAYQSYRVTSERSDVSIGGSPQPLSVLLSWRLSSWAVRQAGGSDFLFVEEGNSPSQLKNPQGVREPLI